MHRFHNQVYKIWQLTSPYKWIVIYLTIIIANTN